MQRSQDRGLLGRPRSETDAVTPLSRRERRQRTAPEETRHALTALFTRTQEELPDGRPMILMVCVGNICRSPLAETVLATRLAGVDVAVRSAGTHALVGHGMPAPSRRLAAQSGVAPELFDAHRATLLTEQMMTAADLVLTMTSEISMLAVRIAPRRLLKTFTLREFGRLADTLTDRQLVTAAERAENPRSRFNAVITAVTNQRGIAARGAGGDDIIDPYHQSEAVYERSAAEMLPSLVGVERAVRAALA